MNIELSASGLVQAWGWTLVHSLWEGLLIGFLVFILARTVSAERRYLAHCLGMVALLAAVVATLAFEAERFSPRVGEYEVQTWAIARPETQTPYRAFFEGGAQGNAGREWSKIISGITLLWFFGVVFMTVRAFRAAWGVRVLRQTATAWNDPLWQEQFCTWVNKLAISRPVRLCLTTMNDVPAVIGHFKPIVLLPVAIVTRLTPGQVEALILHELMHIRRNDYLASILQLACETLLFFHPVAWWFSHSMREEREHCCDAAVTHMKGNPLPYAKALLALEELRVNSPGLLAVGAGDGSLKRRVARLLAPPTIPARTGAWAVSLSTLLLLGALAFWCWPKAVAQQPTDEKLLQVRWVVEEGGEVLPFVRGAPATLRVADEVVLDDSHVIDAKVDDDPVSGQQQILVRLNNEGGARLSKATKANVGRQIAIVVNRHILSAPMVRGQLPSGHIIIGGNFTAQQAAELARKLTPRPETNSKEGGAVRFQSYFLKVQKDPASRFQLTTKIDSTSDDFEAWSLSQDQARRLIDSARQDATIKLLAAPTVTTSAGKVARVEVRDVPDEDGVFSAKATGYIFSEDPNVQGTPVIAGQSIEFRPEFARDSLIVAGTFVDSEKVTMKTGQSYTRTSNHTRIYIVVPKHGAFALSQKTKRSESSHLLLVVIPQINP